MPEIEFVDNGFDPGQDEELDTVPRRSASRRTKRNVWISAGAILAVVAGSTLFAVLHHGDGHPSRPGRPVRRRRPARTT